MDTNLDKEDVQLDDDTAGWSTIIGPERKWFDLKLKETWHYRDLIWLFVKRDFVTAYKQTILGFFWFFFPPIVGTFVKTIFYGNVISLPTDGLPPFLFYMSGSLMFGIFSASYASTSDVFVTNAGLFGKVYFPRLTVPIAGLTSSLVNIAAQFAIFLFFVIMFRINGAAVYPNAWMLSVPILLLLSMGLGLGAGLIASVLSSRYRDIGRLFTYGIGLLPLASPLIYPLSQVPEKYKWIFYANPMTPVVEAFRYSFLGQGTFELLSFAYGLVVMIALLIVGLLLFNQTERDFLDTV